MGRASVEKHVISMDQFIKQIYEKANASSRKTVFLDRDGILNKEVNYLFSPRQVHFLPGVSDGIKKLNNYNIVVIVVTNQPVVARGLASIKDVKQINNFLVNLLNKEHAYINAVYFCPHHPERDHPDIPLYAMKYRIECECRKPKVAMLRKAIEDFNINLKSAYIVGDRTADIKAGENLGIKTILIKTGYEGRDNKYPIMPDYVSKDFSHAVDIIINQ